MDKKIESVTELIPFIGSEISVIIEDEPTKGELIKIFESKEMLELKIDAGGSPPSVCFQRFSLQQCEAFEVPI